MYATRALFIILLFFYFIIPAVISSLVFNNEFYIYSRLQSSANSYSIAYGILFSLFVYVIFKSSLGLAQKKATLRLVKWRGTSFSYYVMMAYSLVLILYGFELRSLGASREDLLGGIDAFLLPGMSLILLFASLFAVTKATRLQFYSLFALFLLIDIAFNGKIFSFLALVLFFVRLDLTHPSRRAIIRAFAFWAALGLLMLLLTGLMRISLAGDDLNFNAIGIAYLFGSEFLGVQASIGWGMDYFAQGYPIALWNFGSALQEFYITSVGHGLATSPGAFLQANFGDLGPIVAVFGCLLGLIVFRFSARSLGLVVYLIVAINFQHFLRHGLDVFMLKLLSQMIVAILVAILINPFGRFATLHSPRPLPSIG